jgi:hypothetical protein
MLKIEAKTVCKKEAAFQLNSEFWDLFCSEDFLHTRKVSFKTFDEAYMFLVSQSPLVDENEKVIGRFFYFVNVSALDK